MNAAPKLQDNLSYPPRAMRADRAAAYLGSMSKSKFLELVDQGRLPRPVQIDGITMWDRFELDAAFDQIKADQTQRSGKRNTVDMVLGRGGDDDRN
jgi:predicted DNA-binding transcriptional regulator AlpA